MSTPPPCSRPPKRSAVVPAARSVAAVRTIGSSGMVGLPVWTSVAVPNTALDRPRAFRGAAEAPGMTRATRTHHLSAMEAPALSRVSSPRRRLAHHLARRLVVAQPEEARVSQASVARPLGEADLRHELWLHPRDAALADRVLERCRRPPQRREPVRDVAQRGLVEAGAHLAGVAQLAVGVVTDEERAEIGPRPARRRVSPD